MLGHELRNPLSPIVTATQLMRLRGETVFDKERTVIERQCKHMIRLVDDLLDVSRITRGTLELELAQVDLADAIADGVEAARQLIDQRKQVLVVATPPQLYVRADRARIAQVVTNLLTNAARYTEPGGRITITTAKRGKEYAVLVRDDGVGMPADLVPHVFEIFTRGMRSIDRSAGGLGLGLAIVKSLTEKHGGRVAARSDGAGRGSEFEFTIPMLADAATPNASVAATPGKQTRRGRVLLVDDNIDAALMLAEGLEQRGLSTVVAHDGPSAIELVREDLPQVAIVDIGLPGMDGYALAKALHALPGAQNLPVVALTGYGQPSDRQRSESAGFAAHFVKPVTLETLIMALDLFL
jgi:CheY-like chemotaxis protein/two-component sensor histidine kinase